MIASNISLNSNMQNLYLIQLFYYFSIIKSSNALQIVFVGILLSLNSSLATTYLFFLFSEFRFNLLYMIVHLTLKQLFIFPQNV